MDTRISSKPRAKRGGFPTTLPALDLAADLPGWLSQTVIVLAILIVSSVYLWSAPLEFPMDDTYIHFVYAENLSERGGLFFNFPDEVGVGTSSLLWVLLLAAGNLAGLSFALYAFASPLVMGVFFDDDWGVLQLYGLFFDTVLLATGAVAFLRSHTIWVRVLSLQAVVLILVVKGMRYPSFVENLLALRWSAFLFIIIYFGFLLLPAVIGLLRGGVNALSSR